MPDSESFVTGGGPADESFVFPQSGPSAVFSTLRWAIITTPPVDAPAVGSMRLYVNEGGSAPYRRLYVYSGSGWSYVEV
jgi:hypothetical protein